ncbi:hypothetical protein [Kitasatospora viridis]|uniref:Uncharacterized protein n=1 Tax=Kitasatospora viridis TaxID=281105 RepID=A0A561SEM9_9ACTN|nr:hypothetical protein [Kitasatospora viridis]TWF73323.1 hypothetical protein FHX73_16474 [Kitasatospora viridis]
MAQRSPESRLNRIALGLVVAAILPGLALAARTRHPAAPPPPDGPVSTQPVFPPPDQPPPETARLVTADAVDAGKAPVGALIVAYRHGPSTLFIWQTVGHDLCGEYAATDFRVLAGCVPGAELPAGGAPVVRPLLGPDAVTTTDWLAVLVADREQLRSLGCAGARITPRQVARLTAPDGEPLAAYVFDAPWMAAGVLEAQVQRPGGLATEAVPINAARADQHAKYSRTCTGPPWSRRSG